MSEATAPAAWWANPSDRALDCAQDHLERLGYRVLARQFRDADLIAGRGPLADAGRCGKPCGARLGERAGQLGEDRQVGAKSEPLKHTHPERQQRPLILEPTELALHGWRPP